MASREDAWKQYHDLREEYCRSWRLRSDLEVDADGIERHIRINTEPHNVATIREFIAILTLACDVVERANPTWANPNAPITPPIHFQTWPEVVVAS